MSEFKFIKTVQYTEVVVVRAERLSEAKSLAVAEDGDRNQDDTVVEIELVD